MRISHRAIYQGAVHPGLRNPCSVRWCLPAHWPTLGVPHANENTNGLLRQYLSKGTDLARWNADELDAVAAGLNGQPRKVLAWRTPAEVLDESDRRPARRHSQRKPSPSSPPLEAGIVLDGAAKCSSIVAAARVTASTPMVLAVKGARHAALNGPPRKSSI
jgi:hypothetical protein